MIDNHDWEQTCRPRWIRGYNTSDRDRHSLKEQAMKVYGLTYPGHSKPANGENGTTPVPKIRTLGRQTYGMWLTADDTQSTRMLSKLKEELTEGEFHYWQCKNCFSVAYEDHHPGLKHSFVPCRFSLLPVPGSFKYVSLCRERMIECLLAI